MYEYNAYVTDAYDGDSITVDIDCGLYVWVKQQKIRLYGINTPELRGDTLEEGRKSRDRLRELILNKHIILKTIKDKKGKYGRWLGIIELDGANINQLLIEEGLAVEYLL